MTKLSRRRLARGVTLPPQSEDSFQRQVIQLAKYCGWRVAHFRAGMTKSGRWVTPVQGDGNGFPDLVLVRGNRIIFAELKSEAGALSREQQAWLVALEDVPGVEVWVWRPKQWETVERLLA